MRFLRRDCRHHARLDVRRGERLLVQFAQQLEQALVRLARLG
jgi:hypothetical protein